MYMSSENSKRIVQIVRGELRAIGHTDKFGNLRGWVWANSENSRNPYQDMDMFHALKKEVYDVDKEFLEEILDRLTLRGHNKRGYFNLKTFESIVEEKEIELKHSPREVLMAVFNTDDYGTPQGAPIATVKIMTTGNAKKDRFNACVEAVGKGSAGFYTAYYRSEIADAAANTIDDLREEIAAWQKVL